jgi:hypothetical protein
MKRYISAILIPCLLLQLCGCYTSLENVEDINDYLKSTDNLKFILKNQDYIIANSKDCSFILEPDYFIYGFGTLIDKRTNSSKSFNGEIKYESIDSVKNIVVDSQKYFICWLKDSTRISFEDNDYVNITPQTDPNFWLIKEKKYDIDSYKMIYANDIDEIQVENKGINLALGIILGAAAIALLVAVIVLANSASKVSN